ncbi:MAG: hypothetical protein KKH12_06380 [Gammaproteobacteria bacterium]|nr:hypothetical protein [Gammaproteobacteria bacterium]MBU1481287.1 hypothetical protein [Gammaproteobacteria bacterium]
MIQHTRVLLIIATIFGLVSLSQAEPVKLAPVQTAPLPAKSAPLASPPTNGSLPMAVSSARLIPLKTAINFQLAQVSLPPLCVSVSNTCEAISQKYHATEKAMSGGRFKFQSERLSYFNSRIKMSCCSKGHSFSVADQQAAGCTGSDTVTICMEKLSRNCIREAAVEYKIRDEFLAFEPSVSELSTKAGQLSQEMKHLQAILP